jgi:hypothetical protein
MCYLSLALSRLVGVGCGATVDGKNAAASTARRHRTILANAMDYAVERGMLDTNPIRVLKWTAPKVSSQVDRRSVVNPRQARALLAAVGAQQPSGPTDAAWPSPCHQPATSSSTATGTRPTHWNLACSTAPPSPR